MPANYSEKETAADSASRQSRLISSVLSPAVRLWLRSQVESVADLQFQLEGGDRQLLSGYVPKVAIAAQRAVYQGLHLSQVALVGKNIRVNFGQVLRGKPLQLLEVVPVHGSLVLYQTDLTASLQAPLLATALSDLMTVLFQPATRHLLPPDLTAALGSDTIRLIQPQVALGNQQLTLGGILANAAPGSAPKAADRFPQPPGADRLPFLLRTGITIASGSQLCLQHPILLPSLDASSGTPLPHLHQFAIDLGPEVEIQELLVEPQRLVCRGRVCVVPG